MDFVFYLDEMYYKKMSNFDSNNLDKTVFIDIGNSSIKLGLKKSSNWKVERFEHIESVKARISEIKHVQEIFVSSVRKEIANRLSDSLNSYLVKILSIEDLKSSTLDYDTPQTLGIDRYLACLGAKSKTKKAVVVIDAGSACTIDYMNENGVYKGGVIMPGLHSFLNIFKNTAPELPEIRPTLPNEFPGKSTKSSLEIGLNQFFVDGINANLDRYSEFGEFDLYVTGGDAERVSEWIGNIGSIDRNLVFEGMEKFLELGIRN